MRPSSMESINSALSSTNGVGRISSQTEGRRHRLGGFAKNRPIRWFVSAMESMSWKRRFRKPSNRGKAGEVCEGTFGAQVLWFPCHADRRVVFSAIPTRQTGSLCETRLGVGQGKCMQRDGGNGTGPLNPQVIGGTIGRLISYAMARLKPSLVSLLLL